MRVFALLTLLLTLPLLPTATAEEDAALAEARALRESGDHGQAIAELQEILGERPGDAVVLHELARTYLAQSRQALAGNNPTLGRLALLDALKRYRECLAARPDWSEALRGYGDTLILSGDLPEAAKAFRRAVELDPEDGESHYQLGYVLAYQRKFEAAATAFDEAQKHLGPQARILLNRGICRASLGRVEEAEGDYVRLLETEVAAGRRGSWEAKRGLARLWQLHAEAKRFDRAEKVFAALAEKLSDYSSAWWYLGHARWQAGRGKEALEPFRAMVRLNPRFGEGQRMLALSASRAGEVAEAMAALEAFAPLAADPQQGVRLLLEIVEDRVRAGDRAVGIDLLVRGGQLFPEDPDLIERRGDLLFREKRYEDAIETYRKAAEANPFSSAPGVKAAKAVTVLRRRGKTVETAAPEVAEPVEGGPLYDFEETRIFVRPNGSARAAILDGAIRVERTGEAQSMANLALTFIPTLDTTDYDSIRFTVRGPAKGNLQVMAKDCFDEFGTSWVRLWYADAVTLTGEKQVVTLSLDRFETPGERKIPLHRARLRGLIFELGIQRADDVPSAAEVTIDDIEMARGRDHWRVLADFEFPEDPTLFLTDGAAGAFARTLFTVEESEAAVPDPNTYVRPTILGDAWDPGLVHGGEGSFRLTLARAGAASGFLTVGPERAKKLEDSTAIVFWAKGAVGGKRVRMVLRDRHDEVLDTPVPTTAPRMTLPNAVIDGVFVLTTSWKRYRVSRAAFPDVDFAALRFLRFNFGADVGNAPGTRWYIDDIGWE